MKVIVVDDSLVMRRIIAGILEELGHDTVHAGNGRQMLDVLEQQAGQISMVLLDWNMPGMNGIEALREMRGNGNYHHIPVFMVSTESEDAKIREAIGAGAKDYLAKPFTAEELAAKIEKALGKK